MSTGGRWGSTMAHRLLVLVLTCCWTLVSSLHDITSIVVVRANIMPFIVQPVIIPFSTIYHSVVTSFVLQSGTRRTMQVIVDGETSKNAPVSSGVPQGTILDPLLFLIHINDMSDVLREGTKLRLFADDILV